MCIQSNSYNSQWADVISIARNKLCNKFRFQIQDKKCLMFTLQETKL